MIRVGHLRIFVGINGNQRFKAGKFEKICWNGNQKFKV